MSTSAAAHPKTMSKSGDHDMNLRLLKTLLGGVLLSLLLNSVARAADVSARLDRTEVVAGETITLILETDDPQQSLVTDLSGLQEHFEILDQRTESQMSIVNGQQTAVVRLVITLEPRRAGELLLPPMSFEGGASTPPLRVTVRPAPELAPGEAPPVFIELELDPKQGPYYVHAQLSLTIRIFYQQNLTEAAITPPTPQQASVRLLDEVPYQSTRNEVRYRVLERRYAIFPERSGSLQISPLSLTGRLIDRPADRLWQPSARGRRVRVESEPLEIEVLPKPPGFPGEHWLPARRITMSQQVSDAQGLMVGEPVTRTVILDAVGLEENMIEEPSWPELPGARIYPDQPQGISRDDGRWVLGHKEFRYAVVPEQEGELVLPEIRLHWWDTASDSLKTAVLPEHRVPVAASRLALDIASAVAAPGAQGAPSPADLVALQRWRLLALALALLWLTTLALYLRKAAPARTRQTADHGGLPEQEAALLRELEQACLVDNAGQVRRLLGRWLRRHGPAWAHGSLLEFAEGLESPELGGALRALDADSFRDSEGPGWDGRTLWRHFSEWTRARRRAGAESRTYPDLYAAGKQP